MKQLVLHPQTERQLQSMAEAPAQAMLLIGPAGSGKKSIAVKLAESILAVSSFGDYPYGMTVKPEEGKAIGIKTVRQLQHFLSLKVPVTATYNRAIIINDGHLLTLEAQNALLKTLEEPPSGTAIILTASHEHSLLPTINSRLSKMEVNRPSKQQSQAYFEKTYSQPAIDQAYAISGGRPGLMQALLDQPDHPLILAATYARKLLGKSTYDRLIQVDELAKQPQLAKDTVQILQQMAHLSLKKAEGRAAAKWQAILTASYEAAEALDKHAQPKLVLTTLMLNL